MERHKDSFKKANYEFVTAVENAIPKVGCNIKKKTVGRDDPLHTEEVKEVYSFQKEFKEFTSILEDESRNAEKFSWCPRATKFFLRKCLERKEKFRHLKVEKELWTEILQEMNSAGFRIQKEKDLEKKLTYIKGILKMYNQKSNNCEAKVRVIKPYLSILKELFSNEHKAYNDFDSIDESCEDSDAEETINEASKLLTTISNNTNKNKRKNALQYLRVKQIHIKQKKAEMSRKIMDLLKETTKLQEERNNLILELISMRKSTDRSRNQIKLNLDDINFNKIFEFI